MKYREEKIGNVTLRVPTEMHNQDYQDRGTEDDLLELFSGDNPDRKRQEILSNDPSWPMLYHLTPLRGNLFRGYEFKKGAKILEVGAGPGGVTEALVEHDVNVTAVELTYKRARINAERNKTRSNLTIHVGNIEDFASSETFDYVVCVGVLEYSGRFIEGEDPYMEFMTILQRFLKKNGKLLLAIENRFGLKYWTGAKEDHVHTFFEGHNNYPLPSGIKTFGRKELSDLALSSGFGETYFYYPFPDYKTPVMLYSDDYYPGHYASFPSSRLPTKTLDRARQHLISEQLLMPLLEQNDMFRDFSNSFLLEATK